ncbi:hypothetical protein GDO81_014498 [Engystomops pustulosus]|uniref:Galectin n=1 Tax=Engystomops pustulosus TaxID=76066 RepID=A0AAV7BAX2_ENGPU|nr:hypothetical protein GDO81_014498 [Engystomops pustulosus]
MVAGAILKNLELTPGHGVEVKVFIPPDCKRFAINIGEDVSNINLHFNPRFDHEGDVHRIVCNSLTDNVWGSECREDCFPFHQGAETTVKIDFEFQDDKINIKLDSGEEMSFPLSKTLTKVSFLSLEDVQLKTITIL